MSAFQPDARAIEATATPSSVEDLIEATVERAVGRVLGPYLHRLTRSESAVYTVAQAAEVLQVSHETIGRMVRRGILPRNPHLDGKILIPRRAIDELVENPQPSRGTKRSDGPDSSRSINSAAS